MLRSGQQGCDLGAFDDLTDVGDEIPMPRVRTVTDCVVVELLGEVDILTFHRLAPLLDSLASGPYRTVVVDLTGTTFFDCSGLRLLEHAARRARQRDGRVAVVCRHRLTLRLIELGGLTGLLAPAETVEEAMADDR
ncbi:anti-sigma factor antagonist [Streptomyces sp. SDT5-1]|uniref:anti-sigma factor antagonist n=1 Tax=Streptomyces sp. SDT5-1 TaxID=3406418 RepID=UPI003FD4AA6A